MKKVGGFDPSFSLDACCVSLLNRERTEEPISSVRAFSAYLFHRLTSFEFVL